MDRNGGAWPEGGRMLTADELADYRAGHIQWIPHDALPPSPRCRLGLLAVGAIIGFGLPFFIAGAALLVTDTRLRVEVVADDRLAGECYFCRRPRL